jgi:hypothetical protein
MRKLSIQSLAVGIHILQVLAVLTYKLGRNIKKEKSNKDFLFRMSTKQNLGFLRLEIQKKSRSHLQCKR